MSAIGEGRLNITSVPQLDRLSPGAQDAEFYSPSMFMLAGRIGRVRYFAYSCALAALALVLAAGILLTSSGMMRGLLVTMLTVLLVPAIFVLVVRRLNDLDRSGWISLVLLIPLLNVALSLYAAFARGSAGANRFGPAPTPNSQKVWAAAFSAPVAFFMLGFAVAASPFVTALQATSA